MLSAPPARRAALFADDKGRTGDPFDPLKTGIDHVAFEVAGRAELDSRMNRLDRLAVSHSRVRAVGHSSFVSVQDPDGIQIELWLTITAQGRCA